MKPLKGINMLGNCQISSFSPKPLLINSQLITKARVVLNKKLLVSRRRVDSQIRKCGLPCFRYYTNRGNLRGMQ